MREESARAGQGNSGPTGFHDGELAVQRRAGTRADAARLEGMLGRGCLTGGFARFLADRTFAVITARDTGGRLWVSPLAGPPGFLEVAGATTLGIGTTPVDADPLHGLPAGQPAGLLVIDFAARRRVRINGTLSAVTSGGLRIEVEQAYGNCPQYIQRRVLKPADAGIDSGAGTATTAVGRGRQLTAQDRAVIRRADTIFVGTSHPTHGADASHRGGAPGFVRDDEDGLWWPDYHGNTMFNTLGNLAVDAAAAVLVADFTSGEGVQLSGTALTDWTAIGVPGDDDGTGRRVRLIVEEVAAGRLFPVRAGPVEPYARNPPVSS